MSYSYQLKRCPSLKSVSSIKLSPTKTPPVIVHPVILNNDSRARQRAGVCFELWVQANCMSGFSETGEVESSWMQGVEIPRLRLRIRGFFETAYLEPKNGQFKSCAFHGLVVIAVMVRWASATRKLTFVEADQDIVAKRKQVRCSPLCESCMQVV